MHAAGRRCPGRPAASRPRRSRRWSRAPGSPRSPSSPSARRRASPAARQGRRAGGQDRAHDRLAGRGDRTLESSDRAHSKQKITLAVGRPACFGHAYASCRTARGSAGVARIHGMKTPREPRRAASRGVPLRSLDFVAFRRSGAQQKSPPLTELRPFLPSIMFVIETKSRTDEDAKKPSRPRGSSLSAGALSTRRRKAGTDARRHGRGVSEL
jgi:hypothetical protein